MRTVELEDGGAFRVRPIRPSDKDLLVAGLSRLSDRSVQRRFLGPKPGLSGAELRYLTELDGHDHVALVALPADGEDEIVAVARFVRWPGDPLSAEAAIVVADCHQGRGLGRELAHLLADAAAEHGVRRFTASMLGENVPAHRLMRSLSTRLTERIESGVSELVAELAA